MSLGKTALSTEELRAILVLGIIASLLAARDLLNVKLGAGFSLVDIANALTVYWGGYLFLIVIGISRDVIYRPVAERFTRYGKVFFLVGVAASIGMSVVCAVALLVPTFVATAFGLGVSTALGCAVAVAGLLWLMPESRKHWRRVKRALRPQKKHGQQTNRKDTKKSRTAPISPKKETVRKRKQQEA